VNSDRWPKDQEDPLADPVVEEETPPVEAEVEAGPEEEAPEPEPEPIQAETPEPEATDEEQADWKRRHDALRDTQRRTAEERNDAIRQRDEALALARQVYEAQQKLAAQAPVAPTPPDPAMVAKAAELGITDEQFAFMQQLADERAKQATGVVQEQYQQDQEQFRQQTYAQQVSQQRMAVVNSFRQIHPDAVQMEDDIFEVLKEVGMVDERNEFVQPELRMDHLEAAYEAAKDPELRNELRANPQWYDTDTGMEYARRQASLAKLLAQAQPVTSSSSVADSEAAVAAAETLPASGGPPPGTGGPPGDEFDKVLEYEKNHRKSVFS
jgi:hypothetical protein